MVFIELLWHHREPPYKSKQGLPHRTNQTVLLSTYIDRHFVALFYSLFLLLSLFSVRCLVKRFTAQVLLLLNSIILYNTFTFRFFFRFASARSSAGLVERTSKEQLKFSPDDARSKKQNKPAEQRRRRRRQLRRRQRRRFVNSVRVR